jgi:hypothetical protein
MSVRPRVLLITGTAGSGKTSIALEIGSIMPEKGLPIAVLDLDWLGYAFFDSKSDQRVGHLRQQNLAAVWPNFRDVGVTHLVLSHAIRSRDEVGFIRQTLHGADVDVVRLIVSPETVNERLRERDSGVVLETHLGIAAEIARDLDEAHLEDFAVRNEDRSLRAVAIEILRIAGWIGD